MSLINETYFVRELSLPSGKFTQIQDFVNRYESRIIYRVFGYALGKLIIDADESSDQRIKDLINGKEYTVSDYNGDLYKPSETSDIVVKYPGLKDTDDNLIANWVYYWWLKEHSGFLTPTGGKKSKGENAQEEDFTVKAVEAWNRVRELSGYYGQDEAIASVYNFIKANEATYPEWVFNEIDSINRFGL